MTLPFYVAASATALGIAGVIVGLPLWAWRADRRDAAFRRDAGSTDYDREPPFDFAVNAGMPISQKARFYVPKMPSVTYPGQWLVFDRQQLAGAAAGPYRARKTALRKARQLNTMDALIPPTCTVQGYRGL